jgi:hypothetical protein
MRARLIAILICLLVIIINHKCFAVPRLDTVHVWLKSEPRMVEQVELVDIFDVAKNYIIPDQSVLFSRISTVRIPRTPHDFGSLTGGQNNSSCGIFRPISPQLFQFGLHIVKVSSYRLILESAGIYNNSFGNRVTSIAYCDFISDAMAIYVVDIIGKAAVRLNFFSDGPRSLTSMQSIASVVSGSFGNQDAQPYKNQSSHGDNCPAECDVVQAVGGPKLSRPEIALPSLMLFLLFAYLADRKFDRWGAPHPGFWLAAVIAGVLFSFSVLPIPMQIAWWLLRAATS